MVEPGDVAPEKVAVTRQQPAEASRQQEAEGAMGSPLLEEVETAAQSTAQRKLSLDQHELGAAWENIRSCGDPGSDSPEGELQDH